MKYRSENIIVGTLRKFFPHFFEDLSCWEFLVVFWCDDNVILFRYHWLWDDFWRYWLLGYFLLWNIEYFWFTNVWENVLNTTFNWLPKVMVESDNIGSQLKMGYSIFNVMNAMAKSPTYGSIPLIPLYSDHFKH